MEVAPSSTINIAGNVIYLPESLKERNIMYKIFFKSLIASIFIAALIFTASQAAEIPGDETKLEEAVKQIIKNNPKLLYDTINRYVAEQQKKKQTAQLEADFKNRVKDSVTAANPVKGAENAPITIIEYSDFQCPYCARGANSVSRLLKIYPEKVKLAFKNLPLSFHKQALPAAKATLAAHKQGKFWQYHDILFKNYNKLNEKLLLKAAQDLKLDMEKFNTDRKSLAIADQIKAEQAQAAKNGITGTPAFIANGVIIKGAQPINYFVKVVNRLLKEEQEKSDKK